MKRNDSHLGKALEDCEYTQPSKKKLKNIEETSSESDCTDNEDDDKCAICLAKLYKTQIGSPEGCDHRFCLKCILEWSKVVNTCPIDRRPFQLIFARDNINDDSGTIINIKTKDNRGQAEENDVTLCEVCSMGDREDRLLLCDGCNKGYHLECLTPPLLRVPRGEWHCEDCRAYNPNHTQNVTNRVLPRTMIYHRVMRSIRRLHENESSDDGSDGSGEEQSSDIDDVDDEDDNDNEEEDMPCTSVRLVQPPRKRKSTKRKSKKRKGSKRRRKRSSRKRRRLSHTIPTELRGPTSRAFFRSEFGGQSLSIFGHGMALVQDEEPCTSSTSAQRSTDSPTPSTSTAADGTNSFDILGDILNSQALLHSSSSDIAIGRDGRLKSLKPLPDMRLQALNDGSKPSSSFFLRDLCSPASLPSSSSSRSSPSLQTDIFPSSSSYSQFSDFSDSSNDAPRHIFENNYNPATAADRSKSKSQNESVESARNDFRVIGDTLYDKTEEYSPVCDDFNDDSDGDRGEKGDNNADSLNNHFGSPHKKASCDSNVNGSEKDTSGSKFEPLNGLNPHSQSSRNASPIIGDIKDDGESMEKNQCSLVTIVMDSGNVRDVCPPLHRGSCVETHNVDLDLNGELGGGQLEESIGNREVGDANKCYEDDEDSRMDVDFEDANDNHDQRPEKDAVLSSSEKAKRLAIIENLMREALKTYYQSSQISKQDYKVIMKKGVLKIMKSRDRRIEPAKVKKFVDQYVIAVLRNKNS